ncbi:DUF3575 domain-containing protein [Tenacibaculum ovolyticum]|uniref:DUF3575 domain-containing protein n=1 Tax=Tenacibaculum ovolyticum TaxID=104270 RepID=UPI0022F384A5|nr:DUF3575 domain-containing protein [Tenacibaculum ovolyticum]WBX74899.1 DUF3575 domain-containing protein [Tenacibaculum ovolyticum]
MKTKTVIFLLFISTFLNAQKNKESSQYLNKKNEIKINLINLIDSKFIDISYEYLINEKSSIGIETLFNFNSRNKDITKLYNLTKFSLTPYYRRYFSKKYARGFFIEGFSVLKSYENYSFNENEHHPYMYIIRDKLEFSLGLSIGAKFVIKERFVADIFLGVGKNFISYNDYYFKDIGRGGISLGYRF